MIACGLQLLIGTMAITRAIGSSSTPHVNSMKQTGDLVSGFSDTVIYSFATEAYTKEFLSLLTPLADSVLETEAGFSYTFRPFVAQDGLSVMIMERFVDQAAHDGPHASSSVHHDYLAKVDAWNSTTGVGRLWTKIVSVAYPSQSTCLQSRFMFLPDCLTTTNRGVV